MALPGGDQYRGSFEGQSSPLMRARRGAGAVNGASDHR